MKEQLNKRYDVFRSYLVEHADYDGWLELPILRTSNLIPDKLVPFSKAVLKSWTDFDCWVMFYEHDYNFERLWHNPKRYLERLQKFKGVISPDFSLFRNMPLAMQIWNAYRGHALAAWMQEQGIEVIPNIRFNDVRTYAFCFDGAEKGKTVAVGTHGCIGRKEDRAIFAAGLEQMVQRLEPKTILVYGRAPKGLFGTYEEKGIQVIPFESEISKSRKQVNA